MHYKTSAYLLNELNINKKVVDIAEEVEQEIKEQLLKIDEVREFNQYKVLAAMQRNRLSDTHFGGTTGYGYGDAGREVLDAVYADVFKAEAALVRSQIVSGTHALALCLYGILRPGDEMLAITGKPYDTLDNIIGIGKNEYSGSLKDFGVVYRQLDLDEKGKVDFQNLENSVNSKTKLALIQRSTGYAWRPALSLEEIEYIIKYIKIINPETICMVDNCYGEFIDFKEPTEVGADIIAGSLIKNPGGGIAPTGGYVAGREDLVKMASSRLIAPGIGQECGATLGINRLFFQGFFLAPHIVAESLKGAVFCSKLFSKLGYKVNPDFNAKRSDIIQAIEFGNPEALIAFCQGIQKGSPVDSFVTPMPWDMPGYNDQVIMAAGGFVAGASIELSADAPLREPYIAYLQGGLTYDHVKIGLFYALKNLTEINLLNI